MQYLIEGIDAVGKSTLIKFMQKRIGYRVLKGSSFEQSETDNEGLYSNFFNLYLENDVIFDRSHISNLVYASIFKDYSILSEEQVAHLEHLINHKSRLIYLYASPNFIKNRLDQRGDEYIDNSAVRSILDKYEEAIGKSTLNIRKINVEGKSTEEIFNEAFSY